MPVEISTLPFVARSGLDGRVAYRLSFPGASWFLQAVMGALVLLTDPDNWVSFGDISVTDAANFACQAVKGFEPMPYQIGSIVPFAGAPLSSNLLACDGSEVAQASYPQLYAVIGDTWGSAAEGMFKLPDLRDKFLYGSGTGAIADTGGESEVTLTTDTIPAHSHTDSGHQHTTGNSLSGLAVVPGEGPVLIPNPIPALTGSASANITNTGGGEAHNNMPPYAVIQYAIVAW